VLKLILLIIDDLLFVDNIGKMYYFNCTSATVQPLFRCVVICADMLIIVKKRMWKMANSTNGLHLKLKSRLLNIIGSNRYRIGDRLLPEMELCKELDVSRAALRKVLDELQSEGYIQRVQGSGTIILKKRSKYVLNLSVFGGAAETISGHKDLGIEFFKINEIVAGNNYANLLQVGTDERLLDLERIRTLDGIPAIYTHNVLVKSRMDYQENLYAEIANSLSKTMNWHVETCDADIRFCAADTCLSEKLRIPAGAPLLLVEEIARQNDGLPLDYSQDYYVNDLFEFRIVRRKHYE